MNKRLGQYTFFIAAKNVIISSDRYQRFISNIINKEDEDR